MSDKQFTILFCLLSLALLLGFIAYWITAFHTAQEAVANPISPEIVYLQKECPEKIYIEKDCPEWDCQYEWLCPEMGFCPACPQTFEKKLQECQLLLEELK